MKPGTKEKLRRKAANSAQQEAERVLCPVHPLELQRPLSSCSVLPHDREGFRNLLPVFKNDLGRCDGPVSKCTCYQSLGPEFNLQDLHGGSREPTPSSCPLVTMCTHTYTQINKQIKGGKVKKNSP